MEGGIRKEGGLIMITIVYDSLMLHMADLPARSMFSPDSKADCLPPCFVDKGEAARLPGRLPPHKVSQALRPPPERVGPTPRLLVGFRSDMS